MRRIAVILHERLANWARQLRPRLEGRPIRWFETRSRGDLEAIMTGLACPVVLIDLGQRNITALSDLVLIRERVPDAWVLLIDPAGDSEVLAAARELGATHVFSGFVAPPVVADLVGRWVDAAGRRIEAMGWSRTAFPASELEPWGWLNDLLDPDGGLGNSHGSRTDPHAM